MTFVGNRVVADIISDDKMRSYISVLIRRGKSGHRQREEGHIKMEAEVAVTLPQAKEHMGLPEAEKGKEESSPRAFRGSVNSEKCLRVVCFSFI